MNAENRVFFGERLRHERDRLGFSQQQMAELGGTKPRTYQDWERGLATVSSDFLARISAHGVDSLYILVGTRSFDPSAAEHRDFLPSFEERLGQERKRLGLTIGQLAEKAGVDRLALMKWEEGEYRPDSASLQQLHAAGVDVAYVLLSLVGGNQDECSSAADEQELLKLYRAAPDEQTKAAARRVVGALVDSFLPAKNSKK